MEYIERIQATLDYMENHLDHPITMEALASGFQSHETFARAFKRQFQLTPLEYRKSRVSLALQPFVTLTNAPRLPKGGITMTPTIVTKSAFKLIGYGLDTETNEGQNHTDIPAFWQRYLQENLRANIPNKLRPNGRLGCARTLSRRGALYLCDRVRSGVV